MKYEAIIFLISCMNPQECREELLKSYDNADQHALVSTMSDDVYKADDMTLTTVKKEDQ